MGYAKLTYPNNGTVLATSILHDIVGCVTGRFSSSVQITTATTAEIVNTLGQNWNFTYPTSASFVNSTPNNALGSWVLTAPCVDPTKTKYVRLTNYRAVYLQFPTINNTGTGTSNLYNIGNGSGGNPDGGCGIILQGCLSASSATALISESWYHGTGQNQYGNWSATNITGTEIIVSWSSRHMLIWGNLVAAGTTINSDFIVMGHLEFPENDVTLGRNLIPAATIIERNANLNGTVPSYSPSLAPNSPGNGIIGDIQISDFFNIPSATRSGTSLRLNATTVDFNSSTWTTTRAVNTIPTIDQFGNNTRMMTPLIVNMLSRGQPSINLSALTNVYIVPTGMGSSGNILSGSVGTYAYLPGLSTAFAVRRA